MAQRRRNILARKVGHRCEHRDCGRLANYYVEGEYLCESHFKKFREDMERKGISIIFPSYQEAKFPYTKSNMLRHVGRGNTSLGGQWGKKLRQTSSRRKSSSNKGRRRSKKTIPQLDLSDIPTLDLSDID